jgi:DHA2 family multidrug resistance protein
VDRFSWPYIFYINIPLGSSQPFDSKLCKKSKIWRKTEVESSRLARNYSSGIFIGSLQFVLEHGQQDDWFNNKLIVLLSAVSVFGVILFIWRQLTYKYPIVNLSVLKDGNLRIGTLMAFILGFGLYGSTLIIHIYAIHFGLTATDAGLLLIPGSITTAFMMPIIGKLIQRGVPQGYMIVFGF